MASLLHPVGGQPTWVYWARRAVIVLAAVALVAVGFLLFRQPDVERVQATPDTAAASQSQPASSQTSAGQPNESATPTPTATPTGPLACDQTNSELTLAGYQKVKQDAKQAFKLAITNTGAQDCLLALSSGNFSLTVTSGTDRIWTTGDCAKWAPAKKLSLKPGKAYEFGIGWGVDRSSSGCKTAKGPLKPGTYVASAIYAETVKARQVFQVTKAG